MIPDFREPNIVCLAPAALYVSFNEVHKVADIIKKILIDKKI